MDYCCFCMNETGENKVCPVCGKEQPGSFPAHHLQPGTVLLGKYVIGAALGEGGFGITYVGKNVNLDLKVAIKEFFPNGYVNRATAISKDLTCISNESGRATFEKGRQRFLQEARILAKFSGEEGVVSVYDLFEANKTAYIVMEYLEGVTLKTYLAQNKKLSPADTLTLLKPVIKTLDRVHKAGLIHRDISPDNIMLTGGKVKLLDFGAARDVSGEASLSVMLKHGYAPEEQYRRKGQQGPWTDVYALCATIYKCITGVTPDEASERMVNDQLRRPSELGVQIEPIFEAALMKGLSIFAKDRYQSVSELLDGFAGKDPSLIIKGAASVPRYADPDKTVYGGEEIVDNDKTVYGGEGAPVRANADPDMTVYSEEPYYRPSTAEETPVYTGTHQPKPESDGKKSKKGLIIALASVAAVIVAAVVLVLALGVFRSDETEPQTSLEPNTSSDISAVVPEHTEHSYVPAVTQPTCTEQGYTTYTCSVCGNSYIGDYTAALGHSWGEPTYSWSDDKSKVTATCACTRDGSHILTETVNVTSEITKAATCESDGVMTYSAAFEDGTFVKQTADETIAASGHDFVDGVCTRCGAKRESSGLAFEKNSSGYTVTGIGTCTDTALIIPSEYKGKPVTEIGKSAFSDCTDITSVIIPGGVTTIGETAFYDCRNLKSVRLPDTLETIGAKAFSTCPCLTIITLPKSLKSIGNNAFMRTDLSSINVSSGNSKYYSDGNCVIEKSTKTLVLGCKNSVIPTDGSVTTIGKYAFSCCPGLLFVTIPDTIVKIDTRAFAYSGLVQVTLGSGVKEIANEAFVSCSRLIEICNLSSLTISAGSTDHGNIAEHAKHIYGGSERSYIVAYESYYFYNNYWGDAYLVAFDVSRNDIQDVTLPETFNKKKYIIYGNAFFGAIYLKSITVPDSVKSIGIWAFDYCVRLKSITLPSKLESISEGLFYECFSLREITIPDSVTSIGSYAFQSSGLKSVTIPKNVTFIGHQAFISCKKLETVTLPVKVTEIEDNAFSTCPALKTVYYAGSEKQWKSISTGKGNDALKNAEIHYNS